MINLMEPIFNIDDKVQLQNDDVVYIIKEIKIEKYKIQYKIHSEEDQEYRLWADEINLKKI